uniref:Uncharacterized protein n=1 Tax=Ciona intestinalis TaxID=7719 RepID=H2XK70_CIOIN
MFSAAACTTTYALTHKLSAVKIQGVEFLESLNENCCNVCLEVNNARFLWGSNKTTYNIYCNNFCWKIIH